MKLTDKLKSRKLWMAIAGAVTALVNNNPTWAAIISGVYVVVEGIVDAVSGVQGK
ncbi:hypothetical protein R80B4_00978 [Fibrobacteres bacterium R8-0-B4]